MLISVELFYTLEVKKLLGNNLNKNALIHILLDTMKPTFIPVSNSNRLLELRQVFGPMFLNKMLQRDHSGQCQTCTIPSQKYFHLGRTYQISCLKHCDNFFEHE